MILIKKSLKLNGIEKFLIFADKHKSQLSEMPCFQTIVGSFDPFLA